MSYMIPPGLHYLRQIDQVLLQQVAESSDLQSRCEMKNKYILKDSLGEEIYTTTSEETNCCTRQCCSPFRAFELSLFDKRGREVMHLSRPSDCGTCCFPCSMMSIEICSPPGTCIGYIHQEWSMFFPLFHAKNANDDVMYRIEGPVCPVNCRGDGVFKIISQGPSEFTGTITKKWRGLCAGSLTDADSVIAFPSDMDVRVKAVLIGALVLIDFMYCERSRN